MTQLSTEALLTSPAAFGIASATPAQRAVCRILDGLPLAELATHPDVLELVGGPEALAQLPSERGIVPTEVVVLAAIRSAKSIIACAAAIRATQVVDVRRLGPGEIPRVSLLSLKVDLAGVDRSILLETIRASAVLRGLLVSDTADTITLRHPCGRPIEVAVVAGSKAGGGLVSRWSAGVIFDEAPRMDGASEAVVNLEHARSAVIGRLLPGAQLLYIGSPWAPHGPVYDMVQQHWGKPSERMVVLRGTGPMLNPTWWTPERCARLQQQDPTAYATDVEGLFADPESGLCSPAAVERNRREHPLELPRESDWHYTAALDPSDGTEKGNGFALAIVAYRRDQDGLPRMRVALVHEWRGERPEQVLREITGLLGRYGLSTATTDQFSAGALVDLAHRYGLHLTVEPTTAASKLEAFTNLAHLISTDRLELAPHAQLIRDLLSIKRRTTQQGATIVLPRVGGRHCDLAAALCGAVAKAHSYTRGVSSGIVVTMDDLRAARRPQRDRWMYPPAREERRPGDLTGGLWGTGRRAGPGSIWGRR